MKKIIRIILVICFVSTVTFAFSGCEPQGLNLQKSNAENGNEASAKYLKTSEAEYEAAIRDRFQTGFNNWNRGYLAWLEWCDELYDENAYYNVYGHRMSLDEYKRMMGALFEQFEIMLGGTGNDAGDIQNVLVDAEKGMGAIQYAVSFKKKTEDEWVTLHTMEFVQFRPDDEFGARVVEGWALSDTEIAADQEVMAFWMNPANDWDALLARVATWE